MCQRQARINTGQRATTKPWLKKIQNEPARSRERAKQWKIFASQPIPRRWSFAPVPAAPLRRRTSTCDLPDFARQPPFAARGHATSETSPDCLDNSGARRLQQVLLTGSTAVMKSEMRLRRRLARSAIPILRKALEDFTPGTAGKLPWSRNDYSQECPAAMLSEAFDRF